MRRTQSSLTLRATETSEKALAGPAVAPDDVRADVVDNTWVNSEYKLLTLDADGPASRARPGQFFTLECPSTENDRPFLRRPMSVYRSDPASGRVEFLYKVAGSGTRGLAALIPGRTIQILGPLGQGFYLEAHWKSIVVVGRGVGLATLAPLAEVAAHRGISVIAVISARRRDLLMSVERFRKIGGHVDILLDSEGTSSVGGLETLVRTYHAEGRADAFFTCGSNRVLMLLQRLSAELGVPGQVAMEQQMACGMGMCFSCVRTFRVANRTESRRVCWDGPVFQLEEPLSW